MPNRYSQSYISPKGPGDARPTAMQIIEDENVENQWSDKVVLITGCSSGIGVETARAMAATGARCFCTARNIAKAESALSGILTPGRVVLVEMDQSSFSSVQKAAEEVRSKSGDKLNVLICNAGIMAVPNVELTVDGHESQFGTNHLSHFLLFNLLKDAMIKSSTPEFNSRVVMVSSSGHRHGPPRFGNYDFSDPNGVKYTGAIGYGQSKTSNIYMSNYIDRVFGPQGVHANSLMPGGIFTGLQVHIPQEVREGWKTDPQVQNGIRSPEQGAATQVWAAVAKEWEGRGGKFLEDCDVGEPVKEGWGAGDKGYVEYAFDREGEERLWKDSLVLVGL